MADISSVSLDARPRRSSAGRVLRFLAHRWPTACGLLVTVFSVLDSPEGHSQAPVVFLAALVYLATAVVGRPRVVWILFGAAVAGVVVLKLLDVDLWTALVASAVSLVVVALVSGLPSQPRLAALQIPIMLVVGTAVLVALAASPALGTYLVGAALIGHATLDVIVWRADKVVVRSLAEFCFVLDFTLGGAIIVAQLL
ncbi:hypothetical protein [Nonomuraea zeae]|uniref:Uncharacterized protein n=1 Tax=Nonomuraea zeae TaxID=1642303 RepID=A0A5S4GKM1_9ACTN|nr:hypothetical protein [Nonomuraea zeae]TMR33141.1 hypothetical protein ETD85_20660 [Nonomuraea zeae]